MNEVRSRPGKEGRAKATGTVKWFSAEKCLGFIQREDGADVFVHFSAITGEGNRNREEKQKVEFELSRATRARRPPLSG